MKKPEPGYSKYLLFLSIFLSNLSYASTIEQCSELAATVDRKEREYFEYRSKKYGAQDNQVLILSILGLPESKCSQEDGRVVFTSAHRATAAFDNFNSEQKNALKWAAQQYWKVWLCTIPRVQQNSPYDTRRTRLFSNSGINFHSFELYPRMCPNGEPVALGDDQKGPTGGNAPNASENPLAPGVVTSSPPALETKSNTQSSESKEAVKKLLRVKKMYEAGEISEREYESLKVEIMKLI